MTLQQQKNMAYLVLAFPELTKTDFDLIQEYRKRNDELYFNVVNPHFTIVFPTSDFSENEFVKEVTKQSTKFRTFDFTIRCATINKDAFSDYYHTFLVPDEGFSNIVKLHDKLYSNKLIGNLRLDIDYIPHIGIGNSNDKFICKKMVDNWNTSDFSISGKITQLTIVEYTNATVKKIQEIELKTPYDTR